MHIVFMEPLGLSEETVRRACVSLEAEGHRITYYGDRPQNEQALVARAQDAEVIVLSNIPLDRAFFTACPSLKMISVGFTGVDHIDLEACRERGIVVCNAAGYATEAVAELAVGLMIALGRRVVEGDALTRSGGTWTSPGTELHGKTVGIAGMGAIGRRVAELVQPFGCSVIAYNRTPRTLPGVRFTDKDALFRGADILSLHLPLTPETRSFVGARELALMKPGAVLLNTARGPVVDQDALYEALSDGRIAGAALDVYDREPPLPPDFKLLKAPRLILLPHEGYATREAFAQRLDIVVGNIRSWLSGKPQNRVV